MKSQLDIMKEMQDHPIKNTLHKAVTALEMKAAEIKAHIAELKANIVEGCKSAVTAFREKGAAVLDKLASFFRIKNGLQAIKNNTLKAADTCDRSAANIEIFSKEYHKAGLALKNMGRVLTGRPPIDAAKESGKFAKVVSLPYKAEKSCLSGIRNQVDKMIVSLEKLEKGVEAKRVEKAAVTPKKPTLAEKLAAKKKEIRERELETPKKERVKSKESVI